MAEEIKTPMSDFDKVEQVKDTAEFILLQDGVNARVEAPVFEQKILDKTNGKYLLKSEKLPNENLTFGEVKEGDSNVVSGNSVHEYYTERVAKLSNVRVYFDFAKKEVTIMDGYIYFLDKKNRVYVDNTTISLDVSYASKVIAFDNIEKKLVMHNSSDLANGNYNYLFSFSITQDMNYDNFNVNDLTTYYVNGVKFNTTKKSELALIRNNSSQINFNIKDRKLEIKNGAVIILNDAGRYNIEDVIIDLPFSITAYVCYLDQEDKTIKVRNQAIQPMANSVTLFAFRINEDSSITVNGINEYSVNGVPNNSVGGIVSEQYTITNNTYNNFNFDLSKRILYINGGSIIDVNSGDGQGRILLPISEVEIRRDAPRAVVLWSKNDNKIIVRNQNNPSVKNALVLFTYYYDGTYDTFTVNGLKYYSVNGVPNNKVDIRRITGNKLIPYLPYENVRSQTGGSFIYNLKYSDYLQKYDDAIQGIDFVKKQEIGVTDKNVTLYSYTINKKNTKEGNVNKPKVLIVSGTHGGEKLSLYATYLFFKELIHNNIKSKKLNQILEDLEIIIVPCDNPYACDVGNVNGVSSVRWNKNGVDINRNYDWRFNEFISEIGSQTYKGASAFSEKESQAIKNIVENNKDSLLAVFDMHNFGNKSTNEDGSYADGWISASTSYMHNISSSIASEINFEFKSNYNINRREKVVYSSLSNSIPTLAGWVSNIHNIPAVTLEVNEVDSYNNDELFNSDVVNRALEIYINYIYSVLKHNVK